MSYTDAYIHTLQDDIGLCMTQEPTRPFSLRLATFGKDGCRCDAACTFQEEIHPEDLIYPYLHLYPHVHMY